MSVYKPDPELLADYYAYMNKRFTEDWIVGQGFPTSDFKPDPKPVRKPKPKR